MAIETIELRPERKYSAAEVQELIAQERERCAKVAESVAAEISNAPHALQCKTDWHGNAKTKCTCFKANVLELLAKIRSGE